ncbi:Hypp5655 [Branchiostoma lanceolatum]|uniref:Hypp5655 protein n=1 Tax=Branchiostoma lanceolatum TaxID=7740 RepID=A0A8J9WG00_BRALA|nr:Hypp5655 [Branchiostoma lanceolatum]
MGEFPKRNGPSERHWSVCFLQTRRKRAQRERMEEKIKQVKTLMGGVDATTNTDMIDTLMDCYVSTRERFLSSGTAPLCDFQPCPVGRERQGLFVVAEDSLRYLLATVSQHDEPVSSPDPEKHGKPRCPEALTLRKVTYIGHVAVVKIQCRRGCIYRWTSSPHVGKPFLVNLRIAHGYLSSGILPNQYQRICKAAGIGKLSDDKLKKSMILYSEVVDAMVTASMEKAMDEEIGDGEQEEEESKLSIVTDARHAQRRNSHRSDIMALGQTKHRVLGYAPVTKAEEVSSQRHEMRGTKKLYDRFDELGVQIVDHAHDRSNVINKLIRDRQPYPDGSKTTNSNDTWHATKGIARKFKKVSHGAKRTEGVTWHAELADKGAPVKTHFYWCMARCGGSEQVLRESLLNIVDHYRNQHQNCHEGSRCRRDQNYLPTKLILTDQRAVDLLRTFITSQDVYKHASDYVRCRDTLYVESFNNACLQYLDKRIFFGSMNYGLRMGLAILDWNEHVDRHATSRYVKYSVANPRQNEGQRVLVAKTNTFLHDIEGTFVGRVRHNEDLPALPPRRARQDVQHEDGDRFSDADDSGSGYSSSDE